jgi:hypothetical protein
MGRYFGRRPVGEPRSRWKDAVCTDARIFSLYTELEGGSKERENVGGR